MSRTYGKAQDLIDFTRASSGTALRRVKYGAELVTNGTLDSADGWTVPSGWAIGSGVATGSAVSASLYFGAVNPTAGKIYFVEFDCTRTSGTIYVTVGGNFSGAYSSSGSRRHSIAIVAGSTAARGVEFYGGTFTGTIDNISVKEVTFDTSDGDLLLFNHPNNIPRIEYDADGNLLGLLVEESRVNLVTYSDDMTQMANIGAEVLSNNGVAPDGTTTADFVYATSTGTDKRIYKSISMTSGATYTTSVYAKYAGKKYVRMYNPTIDQYATFDLINGVVETYTTDSAAIQDVGNGWYRCSLTDTAGAATNYFYLQIGDEVNSNNTTTGTSYGAYVWGAQLEAGSFPTSLIPTSGSTATRSADVASLSTSAFGYRQDEGSVVVEFDSNGSDGSDYPQAFSLDGSTTSDAIRAGLNTTNLKQFVVVDSGANQCVLNNGGYSPNDQLKFSIAYKENNFASSDNGDTAITDTLGTVPTISALSIGKWQTGNYINGHIKSLKYMPRRLLNSQLQELTS